MNFKVLEIENVLNNVKKGVVLSPQDSIQRQHPKKGKKKGMRSSLFKPERPLAL
jgi:hypothetical protein